MRELIPLSVRSLSREHYTDEQIESGSAMSSAPTRC
jgi:hypothetical protein